MHRTNFGVVLKMIVTCLTFGLNLEHSLYLPRIKPGTSSFSADNANRWTTEVVIVTVGYLNVAPVLTALAGPPGTGRWWAPCLVAARAARRWAARARWSPTDPGTPATSRWSGTPWPGCPTGRGRGMMWSCCSSNYIIHSYIHAIVLCPPIRTQMLWTFLLRSRHTSSASSSQSISKHLRCFCHFFTCRFSFAGETGI